MYTTCALTLLDGDMWLECVAEGSDGCLVSALWTSMRIQNDENMQRFVWRAICSQKVGSRVRVVTCWPDFRVLLEHFNLFFHSRDFSGNQSRDTLCGVSAWSEHPPTRLLMRDVILKNMTFRVMLLVFPGLHLHDERPVPHFGRQGHAPRKGVVDGREGGHDGARRSFNI